MMELLVAFLVSLCMCCGMLLQFIPFCGMASRRKKQVLYWIFGGVCAGNLVLSAVLFETLGLQIALRYLYTGGTILAVVAMAVNACLFPGRLGEHIFALGMVRAMHFLMISIPQFGISLNPSLTAKQELVLFFGAYTLLVLAAYVPLKVVLCRAICPFLQLRPGSYRNTVFYIPIAYFGAAALLVDGSQTQNLLLQLISSLVSGTMLVLMCWSISNDHKRMEAMRDMEHQLENQKIHYTELKLRVEESRKLNHNLKHHIAAIRGFVDGNDKEGLVKYCDELTARIDGKGQIPYTGNSAVDGVVYHYMQQAQEEQISFRLAGVLRSPGVADIDLCAAIGNALDNAITACKKVKGKREISLIAQTEAQLLSIVIRNSFDGQVKQGEGGLLSTKRPDGRGMGLRSMEAMCDRYGGSFQARWDETSFTVMFLLPLTE